MHCALQSNKSCIPVSYKLRNSSGRFAPTAHPHTAAALATADKAWPRLTRRFALSSSVHAYKLHVNMHCTLKADKSCVPVSCKLRNRAAVSPQLLQRQRDEAVPRLIFPARRRSFKQSFSCLQVAYQYALHLTVNQIVRPRELQVEKLERPFRPNGSPAHRRGVGNGGRIGAETDPALCFEQSFTHTSCMTSCTAPEKQTNRASP